jgi:hypothetical protein
MKTHVRSGRVKVPAEWRQAMQLPFWQRSVTLAVTGTTSRAELTDILAGHLPLTTPQPDPGGQVPGGAEPAEDTRLAARIARRLGRWRNARGVRELIEARAIHPGIPAVYGWPRPAAGTPAYRIWPDGSLTLIGVFGHDTVPARDGQPRHRLTASRFV